MKFFTSLLIVMLWFAPMLSAASNPPSARIDYAMAYVPFVDGVVMFGGWAPPKWRPMNEAWVWNGDSWRQWEMSGAPAFAHHSMAFDAKRNILVVCGRPTPHEGGEYQIWENDGKTWSRKENVPVSSSAQGDPKLTYDSRRSRLVLYVASYDMDAEIWESDGRQWQRAQPTHRPMRCDDNGCQFAYDEHLRKAVLVGEERSEKEPLGWDGKEWGVNGGTGTQTWLWDGTDWKQLKDSQPPRAMWGGMTFDEKRQELMLLTTRMETWVLRSDSWQKLAPPTSPSPSPNGFFGLAYDPDHRNSLFFGGESRQTEPEKEWKYPQTTWIFDGQTWRAR